MFTKENASTYGKKSSRRGKPNKINFEIKDAFKNILNDNIDVLKNDIASMDSVARVNALLSMAKYILPTLKSVEANIEQTNEDATLRKLMSFSESEFDKLD